MPLNFNDLVQKDYLVGYFDRNKKIFTISILIFLLFAAMGTLFFTIDDITGDKEIEHDINTLKADGYLFDDTGYEQVFFDEFYPDEPVQSSLEEDYFNQGTDVIVENDEDVISNLFQDYSFEGFIDLFFYNFSIDFECIIGGLFLSIPSLIITFVNACQIGVLFNEVNIIIILLGVLPHGIFEIPSSIFAFSGALMLTSFELNILNGILSSKTTVKEELNNSIYLVKDAIISVGIVFVLLIIAAFIETFITPLLLWLII